MEGRYHSKREQLETARREVEDFEFSKRKIEERIGEIIEDREQIEERLLEEIRRDSSQLTKRIRALLEARRESIVPFALTVDKAGHDYLKTMCQDMAYEVLEDISQLPQRLPYLYRRLTV